MTQIRTEKEIKDRNESKCRVSGKKKRKKNECLKDDKLSSKIEQINKQKIKKEKKRK